jgi:hypothetical protein
MHMDTPSDHRRQSLHQATPRASMVRPTSCTETSTSSRNRAVCSGRPVSSGHTAEDRSALCYTERGQSTCCSNYNVHMYNIIITSVFPIENRFPISLSVRIWPFQGRGRGSIPRWGTTFWRMDDLFFQEWSCLAMFFRTPLCFASFLC